MRAAVRLVRGTRPGDARRMRAADFHGRHLSAAHFDNAVVLMKLAACELVRLHDRDDLLNPIQRSDMGLIDHTLFADRADDGAELPARKMGLAAHAFDLRDNAIDRLLRGVLSHHDNQDHRSGYDK